MIRGFGEEWLAEAAELRKVQVPPVSALPEDLRKAQVVARGNLDRLEEIYGQAMSLAAAARAKAKDLADEADDRVDKAIRDRASRARDFEAARERIAMASLDALPERRAARAAQKMADMASEIERQVRLRYYGLSGARDDLNNRLRGFAWESNLDR